VPAGLPITVRSLDVSTARAAGIRGRGALLIRPDGSPAGGWPRDTDAVSALRTSVRCAIGDTVRRGAEPAAPLNERQAA
jgi:hypothetical protein